MTDTQLTLDDAAAQATAGASGIMWGRCKSGKRWFWYAVECGQDDRSHYGSCTDPACFGAGPHEHGWAGTESAAVAEAAEAARRLVPLPRWTLQRAGVAADALKRINAARRRARPASGGTDARPVGYLYVPCTYVPFDDYLAETKRWVQEVPIVRTTAKRIYYDVSGDWDQFSQVVKLGFIDRQAFESDTRCAVPCPRAIPAGLVCARHGRGRAHCVHLGAMDRRCYAPLGCGENCLPDTPGFQCAEHGYTWDHCPNGENPCRHGYPAGQVRIPGDHQRFWNGSTFFATREDAEADLHGPQREREREEAGPELGRLRTEMADAHPDRGGTSEGFIAARKRYEEAVRRVS